MREPIFSKPEQIHCDNSNNDGHSKCKRIKQIILDSEEPWLGSVRESSTKYGLIYLWKRSRNFSERSTSVKEAGGHSRRREQIVHRFRSRENQKKWTCWNSTGIKELRNYDWEGLFLSNLENGNKSREFSNFARNGKIPDHLV